MKQALLGSFCLHVQVQEGCRSHVTGVHSLLGILVWGVLGAGVKRVIVPSTPRPSGRKRGLSCGGLGISAEQFVPWKPSRWAEAEAAAASSPPWKITQNTVWPTGCQADALLPAEAVQPP